MSVNNGLFRLANLLALMLCANIAWALETDFGVAAKLEYTDNSLLEPDNEQSEWQRGGLFGFSMIENTDRVTLDAKGVAEYRDFKNNTFNNDWRGDAALTGAWHILPQQLRWEVEDYFSTLLLDSTVADTPDNQINTNVLSTGPVATFRVSSVGRAELGAHYSRFAYESRRQDSNRSQGFVRYLRRHRANLESSLNGIVEQVNFDSEDIVSDYKRTDLFIGASSSDPLNTWALNLGLSSIDKDRGDDVDGFLGRFNWRRYFRTTSYVGINAYTQYTDTGLNLLTAGQQQRVVTAASEQVSGDIFYDKRIELSYQLGSVNRSINIRAEVRDEDYETQPLDRETVGGRINLSLNRSSILTVGAFAEYRKYDYLDQNRKDDDVRAGLDLNYRLGRTLTFSGRYTYNSRESTQDTSEYRENRVLFYIYYGNDPLSYRVLPI
ncbi:hypothetical protein MNBD_GAMMA15-628 [hydrothermal vent metagenome]|uniref:Uncharacterized protein n=1 Tax=hydrothermal vent metagenome TaxID=652676 RepID=A0A3B0YC95_9ZZZZ